MIRVKIHEAKTNLSQLIAAVERGEEVVISRADVEVATLGPPPGGLKGMVEPAPREASASGVREAAAQWHGPAGVAKPRRKPGRLKGLIPKELADELLRPLTPEEIAEWEDGPVFPPE